MFVIEEEEKPAEENNEPKSTVISVDEIAARLDVDRRTIINWIRQGILPGRRIGKAWRIDRQQFEEWYDQMIKGGNVRYSRRTQASE